MVLQVETPRAELVTTHTRSVLVVLTAATLTVSALSNVARPTVVVANSAKVERVVTPLVRPIFGSYDPDRLRFWLQVDTQLTTDCCRVCSVCVDC